MGTHLLFLSQLLAVARAISPDSLFLEEPKDVELFGIRPIVFGCRFSKPVEECRWLQGGGIIGLRKGTYELVGNEGTGDCTLHILRPKIGIDTTFWQCVAVLDKYTKLESKPAIVFVKGYSRPKIMPYDDANNTDSEIHEPVLYVENNHTSKMVVLNSLVDGDARVRWYVDGVITSTRNSVEDRGLEGQLLHSSLLFDMPKDSGPILVQHCLEVRSETTTKTVHISSVYVAGDSYEVRHNRTNELTKLHFKVAAPRLRMIWEINGQEQEINMNRVVVHTEYINTRNFTVKCVDESESPSTYLRWGQYDPEGDADVTDGGYEFSTTKASREMITAHVSFVRPNRYLTLQCQAGSIIHHGIQRTFSAMFTLRYRNACGENFVSFPDTATNKSPTTTKHSFLMFICIYFTYFFLNQIIKTT